MIRSFRIRPTGATSFGTGFLVYVDGREYIVTAAHVVEGFKDSIDLWRLNDWATAPAKLVGSAMPNADVAVLVFEKAISPAAPLVLVSNATVSEQLFFLGFPFGLATQARSLNAGYPIPFIKSGIVSAYLTDNNEKPIGIYLDATNNPGFSGGPVVSGNWPTRIAAIVSGYRGYNAEVVDRAGKPAGMFVNENTGLMVAYDIQFAVDLIHRNPIGPLAKNQPAPR